MRGEFAFKRLLSRIAWRRKSRWHRPEILAAIVADVQAQAPDHIAITGDLTNFSTAGEFAAAKAWLTALAPPDRVTLSPGNHDALVGPGAKDRFAAWSAWLGEGVAFPRVRRQGGVAMVNLCSALPTAPGLAQGELGADQLGRLRVLLETLGREKLCRVLLIHHPPTSGVVSGRKGLRDKEALAAVLAEVGAELVLHGHAHEAAVGTLAGPLRPIPVIGVPSASAIGGHYEPARWHGLEIDLQDGGWRIGVVARGLDDAGQVSELGRYVLA